MRISALCVLLCLVRRDVKNRVLYFDFFTTSFIKHSVQDLKKKKKKLSPYFVCLSCLAEVILKDVINWTECFVSGAWGQWVKHCYSENQNDALLTWTPRMSCVLITVKKTSGRAPWPVCSRPDGCAQRRVWFLGSLPHGTSCCNLLTPDVLCIRETCSNVYLKLNGVIEARALYSEWSNSKHITVIKMQTRESMNERNPL